MLTFSIGSKGSFICTIQVRIVIPCSLLHQLWSTGWFMIAATIGPEVSDSSTHRHAGQNTSSKIHSSKCQNRIYRKKENVLLRGTQHICLWLYGDGHMIKLTQMQLFCIIFLFLNEQKTQGRLNANINTNDKCLVLQYFLYNIRWHVDVNTVQSFEEL